MKENVSRREFLKTTAITGAGLAAMPFSITKGYGKSKVRIGMIGVGGRGTSHVKGLLKRSDVEIPAVCDVRKKHAEHAKNLIVKAGQKAPELYTGGERVYEPRNVPPDHALPIPEQTPESKNAYKKLIARDDLDAVLIATPWRFHTPIAVAAMKAGKFVGVEVPAAFTIDDCWDLVNTSESTGMPCMIMENVCYRRDVMAILNMVRQGLFGEMIHARCGYQHNLRLLDDHGVFGPGAKPRGGGVSDEAVWRTYHHVLRNGDLYPTHGIGPVAHWLDINRGNRFVSLTARATKALGIHKKIIERAGKNSPNAGVRFKKGDVVTSTIMTANGETIIATNNTTLPRPYSLGFRCQGTNGLWHVHNTNHNTAGKHTGGAYHETDKSIYLENESPHHDMWESFEPYQKRYDAPLYKKHERQASGAGHGGMDWYVRNTFVESIKGNIAPPIDVYDAAAWSVIGPLSEESIAQVGAPVEFPDFTKGQWIHNERIFKIDV
jgi:predicted dehydrogenase